MRSTLLLASSLAASLAWPAAAQEAPEYYIDTIFAVTTAERIAQFCGEVEVDLEAANARAEALLSQLAEDGIESETLPGLENVEAGLVARQRAFMADNNLAGAGPEAVCAAARGEIAADTAVGQLLKLRR